MTPHEQEEELVQRIVTAVDGMRVLLHAYEDLITESEHRAPWPPERIMLARLHEELMLLKAIINP